MMLRPFPEIAAADAADRLAEQERFVTPLGDYLSAKAGEGFWNTSIGQGLAQLRASTAADTVEILRQAAAADPRSAASAPAQPATRDDLLDEATWKASEHFRPGLKWDARMSATRAQALAEIHDENAVRRHLIEQSPTGARSLLGFGAELLTGGFAEPLNFIPFAGPAARAAAVARYGGIGGRALVQAGEAAAGTALAQPLVLPSQVQFGDDVGYADAVANIAFGALFGAGFGAAHGGWRAWRDRGGVHSVPAQQAGAEALSKAAADLAEGRAPQLELGDILAARRQVEEEIAALRSDQAAGGRSSVTPSRLSATGESAVPMNMSPTDTPVPRSQAPDFGSQVSTVPPPSANETIRAIRVSSESATGPDSTATAGLDFSGLGSIDASSGKKIVQPTADGNALFALAESAAPGFRADLQALAGRLDGLHFAGARVKDRASFDAKLQRKGSERSLATLGDYLGGRLFADSPGALRRAAAELGGMTRLVDVDDFLQAARQGGYRALHLQVQLGNGLSAEVQLVPAPFRDILKSSHDFYAAWRGVTDFSTDQLREFTAGQARFAAAFDAAFARWLGQAPPSGGGGDGGVAITPSGRRVAVRYEVVELSSLVPSQTDDLAVNPAFPAELQPRRRDRAASAAQIAEIAGKLDPELLGRSASAGEGAPIIGADGVVESGNGRVLALRRAFAQDLPGAERYRAWLASQGFEADGLRQPVLVRRRLDDLSQPERVAFAREANDRATLAMGASERAMADAAGLNADALALHRGGELASAGNRDFVAAWLQGLPAAERGNLLDHQGRLSQDGARRLQAALLARAYKDPALVGHLLEATDDNAKAIGGALLDVAPDWIRLREAAADGTVPAGMDQTAALLRALGLVRQARDSGTSVRLLADQLDMFQPQAAETRAFLELMYGPELRRAIGRQKLAEALGKYAEQAQLNLAGARLFGEPVSALEILGHQKRLDATPLPEPEIEAPAAAKPSPKPEADIAAEAAEHGVDLEGNVAEAPGFQQLQDAGRLAPEDANTVRAAEALAKAADDEAAGMEAAAACLLRRTA
ncbi:hypothetical protein [Ferrovibrio sp.]|uniref:hypothetical protein n=1 Tax=Ferrovibrio sp. TaxID=1917215 RepID=UPI003D11527B